MIATTTPFSEKEISRINFEAIYALTLQLCGLSPVAAPCSRGFKKCWADIIPIWNKHAAALGCPDVFYATLYHIVWREFQPTITNPDLQSLLLLIENELLTDGYAFEVWRNTPEFHGAFADILTATRNAPGAPNSKKQRTHVFRRYLYSRTVSLVIYKNTVPRFMWTFADSHDRASFKTAAELHECYQIFEEVIRCLLPEAASWTTEWADETYILRRMRAVHGVTFSKNYDDFDHLIKAVSLILYDRPYLASLIDAKKFTFSMAQAIWGDQAEKKIETILSKVRTQHVSWAKRTAQSYRGHSLYSHANIINSWLYQMLDEWRVSGDSRLTPKMRSDFMGLAMSA